MTGAIQGTTTSDVSVINQKIQDFKNGKTKITKEELTTLVAGKLSQGEEVSATLTDLIDSYDEIDKNKDGIDYSEFKTYQNSTQGKLSSLGLSSGSLERQLDMLSLQLLEKNSGSSSSSLLQLGNQMSLLNSGLYNSDEDSSDSLSSLLTSSISGSSSSSSQSISQLIQNYIDSKTGTSSDSQDTDAVSDLIDELG